jgi:hypothetical protein
VPSRPSRTLLVVILVPAALVLGLLALVTAQAGSTDDLFVVLVYARNLLEHGAVVHEAGDGPVEGFTSPLDLGLKTLAWALASGDGIRAAWWITTGAYLAALLAALAAAARWTAGRSGVLVLGGVTLCLSPGFAEGTTYLLEAPVVIGVLALVTLGVGVRPSPGRAAWVALLLVLARPELALVALAWSWPGEEDVPHRWRPLLSAIAALALVVLARWLVFGRLAPNSYHAKASDSAWLELTDGLRYLAEFLSPRTHGAEAWAHMLIVATALGLPWLAARARPEARRLALAAPVALLAVVVSGGDGYAGTRLLAPAVFLTLLGSVAVAAGTVGLARTAALVVLCAVAGTRLAGILPDARARLHRVSEAGAMGGESFLAERTALRRLVEQLPPGATLASRHLQMAEYFEPSLEFLDLTGLNERAVVEYPAPGRVRFGRTSLAPALDADVEAIHLHHQLLSGEVLARRSTAGWLAASPALRALLGNPLPGAERAVELAARYRTVTLIDAGGAGRHLNLLVRADVAAGWTKRERVQLGPPP